MRDNLTSKINRITESNSLPVITQIYHVKRLPTHIQIIIPIINNALLFMITCVITLLSVLVILLIAYIVKGKQILSIFKKPILKGNTRDLVYKTLTDLDLSPEYIQKGYIQFKYKDIPFYIEALENKATIRILSCYKSDVSNIKDRELIHCIAHCVNTDKCFKVVLYKSEQENYIDFHVYADILFIKQIPKIKGYLLASLELCLGMKDEVQNMINELDKASIHTMEQLEKVKAHC